MIHTEVLIRTKSMMSSTQQPVPGKEILYYPNLKEALTIQMLQQTLRGMYGSYGVIQIPHMGEVM